MRWSSIIALVFLANEVLAQQIRCVFKYHETHGCGIFINGLNGTVDLKKAWFKGKALEGCGLDNVRYISLIDNKTTIFPKNVDFHFNGLVAAKITLPLVTDMCASDLVQFGDKLKSLELETGTEVLRDDLFRTFVNILELVLKLSSLKLIQTGAFQYLKKLNILRFESFSPSFTRHAKNRQEVEAAIQQIAEKYFTPDFKPSSVCLAPVVPPSIEESGGGLFWWVLVGIFMAVLLVVALFGSAYIYRKRSCNQDQIVRHESDTEIGFEPSTYLGGQSGD